MAHSLQLSPITTPRPIPCDASGCKLAAEVHVQLNADYGSPTTRRYCTVHVLPVLPGFVALVAMWP